MPELCFVDNVKETFREINRAELIEDNSLGILGNAGRKLEPCPENTWRSLADVAVRANSLKKGRQVSFSFTCPEPKALAEVQMAQDCPSVQ
jgi:hypothetical protein